MTAQLNPSRRAFLATTAAGAFALPAVNVLGASDTIRVGCIGTGGRCRHLMRSLATIPNVKMTAVCDVFETNLAEGLKLAAPKATTTKHYKDILDSKDIDAVLIGSP